MKLLFEKFWLHDTGATAIEYGLIASIIGLALIAGLQKYYDALNGTYAIVLTNFSSH